MFYSYVVGDSQHPLVVHGPRGCGKTTLLARAAQCCHTWQPEAVLLVRFVSISAQSHTTEQVVRSIVDQCSVLAYGHQSWAVHVSSYTAVMYATCMMLTRGRFINFAYYSHF
jgi:type II secretory pathway predicted ATPase ExeA